jgi:hypothetical protein
MPDNDAPDGGGGTSTFNPPASQDEFDRMVGDRLARERQKFADYDDLKAKAAKFDEVDAASKTELQRLQDAVAERDSKLADLPRQVRAQAIRFASKASQAGFLDPEDALTFLANDVDLADDAERKPHLVRQQPAKKLPARPKPKSDADGEESGDDGLQGKERAAAALRQFRNT